MKLNNDDVAFIAEQRTDGIDWKFLAVIYGMRQSRLRNAFNYRMKAGIR
jgi:hypothetical protein